MSEYGLILSFDTDDEQFVRGFEAGGLWELMNPEHGITHVERQIHASNTEMVMRMAEARGFDFRAEDVNEDWTVVVLHR